MVGDNIPLRRAASSRFGGRLRQESAISGALFAAVLLSASTAIAEGGEQQCGQVIGRRVLYVAPTDSKSGDGSFQRPFASIMAASKFATPGTTIVVADGDYEGGIDTSAQGSASAPIVYTAKNLYGANIVDRGIASSSVDAGWHNRGAYVVVECFNFFSKASKASWRIGFYTDASHVLFRSNKVHDILVDPELYRSVGSRGGAAIGTDHYHLGVGADVIDNLVYNIGPNGQKSSLVHGIYAATSGRIERNSIENVVGVGIHQWHDSGSNEIAWNSITNARGGGILIGSGDAYHSGQWGDNNIVRNNVIVDSPFGVFERGSVGSNNSYFDNIFTRSVP